MKSRYYKVGEETHISPVNSPVAWDEDALHVLSDRGKEYYQEHLQSQLEPQQNGKGIAVNPDTGVYIVAEDATLAARAMWERYPEGGFVIMTISPEPEYALAARLLAGM